jgi:hypothetical protein
MNGKQITDSEVVPTVSSYHKKSSFSLSAFISVYLCSSVVPKIFLSLVVLDHRKDVDSRQL